MKQISVFSNRNQYSQKIKNTLADKLHQRGYSVLFSFHPNSELNICIGGDGSFIKAVHFSKFSQIPFIGINTGHLGFFSRNQFRFSGLILGRISKPRLLY